LAIGAIPALLFPSLTTARNFVRMTNGVGGRWNERYEAMAQFTRLLFRHYRFSTPGILTDAELRRITMAVTLLMGAGDTLIDVPATLERARRCLPHIQAEAVAQAGHVLPFDQFEVVNERLWAALEPHRAAVSSDAK
jgi:pimeloyl-ACP methyl ester carboxylesterase